MAKTNESGAWDQDPLEGSTSMKRTPNLKQVKVVRDDWDDEEEEEEEEEEESGKKSDGTVQVMEVEKKESAHIWEEANKRAPMPELVVAPASTGQSCPPPPSAALQPTLRILKRPSTSPSSSSPGPMSGLGAGSGGASQGPRGTLAEREAQYQEARTRIFGEKEKREGSMSRVVPEVDPGRDKAHGPDRPAKGFLERRKGKK